MVLLFALVTMISCSNKENKLISQMKEEFTKYELPNFNDPKSFEEVEAKIVDTTFAKAMLQEIYDNYYDENSRSSMAYMDKESMLMYKKFYDDEIKVSYLKDMANDNLSYYKKYKKEYDDDIKQNDSLLLVIKNTPKDEISRINILYKIRANNAMGGKILKNVSVTYYPKENIEDKRHFRFSLSEFANNK